MELNELVKEVCKLKNESEIKFLLYGLFSNKLVSKRCLKEMLKTMPGNPNSQPKYVRIDVPKNIITSIHDFMELLTFFNSEIKNKKVFTPKDRTDFYELKTGVAKWLISNNYLVNYDKEYRVKNGFDEKDWFFLFHFKIDNSYYSFHQIYSKTYNTFVKKHLDIGCLEKPFVDNQKSFSIKNKEEVKEKLNQLYFFYQQNKIGNAPRIALRIENNDCQTS